jgi:hypothetical protein
MFLLFCFSVLQHFAFGILYRIIILIPYRIIIFIRVIPPTGTKQVKGQFYAYGKMFINS